MIGVHFLETFTMVILNGWSELAGVFHYEDTAGLVFNLPEPFTLAIPTVWPVCICRTMLKLHGRSELAGVFCC